MFLSHDAHAALPDRQGGLLTGPGHPRRLTIAFTTAKRPIRFILILWLGPALIAGGCAPAEIPLGAPPTPSQSPVSTTTAPVLPSSSPSPSPSQTPAAPVAVGERLYFEDFAQPASWSLQDSSAGAVSVLDGRLLLSVHDPAVTILQPVPIEPLGDFYAEVELRPAVCSAGDEYGMTIRMKPSGGHYRISLMCEGAARLLRVLPEQTNALTSVTPSDSIIPGGEGTNRLGIVAQGPNLRLFVNRQLVLEERDSRLPVGGLGLFARPGPGGQTTVAFDNLAVYALAPTPTPAP